MRYLALDIGDRRTGLATGDDDTRIVSPVGRIENASEEHLIQQLPRVIKEYEPDAVVIGLPLTMDGTKSRGAGEVD